jgi:hypothetical protein
MLQARGNMFEINIINVMYFTGIVKYREIFNSRQIIYLISNTRGKILELTENRIVDII